MILWRPTCMARILVGAAYVRDISWIFRLSVIFLESFCLTKLIKTERERVAKRNCEIRKVKNVGARWVASQGQKGDLRVATGTKGTRGTQGRFGALDTPATILVK